MYGLWESLPVNSAGALGHCHFRLLRSVGNAVKGESASCQALDEADGGEFAIVVHSKCFPQLDVDKIHNFIVKDVFVTTILNKEFEKGLLRKQRVIEVAGVRSDDGTRCME